ncbi:UDP-glucose/GDP-mannose dehydrogenase family protein [Microbulbifer flavimaris]|uniref:UDP-glucose 6-dehydrogenase n=1 Tax=Microbulbifer flavimaris TaxID=1781068 RepID=A0ABX4HXW9_9GAMM|nr:MULTISPECIES: UDP-glucose/GDP-mannose dehydrogenase family protein [Microbulbifer]KUJ82435.1 UDP-glucose 6-dehydrogenase [Microbulbifer sp. ZGT114]PCO04643.1 UDP-glucose/GDP-mannose dehydrogenase family protein [Microbulbifer flavimaris]
MKVTIFGTGYVGLVTGACLAEVGHHVMCMDVDVNKIDRLKDGLIPIYEPGLEPIVKSNIESGNLLFTTSTEEAVNHGQVQIIAVGTPPDEDGSADLQYVLAVAESIATHMDDEKIIVNKSTVPVGTADKVRNLVETTLRNRSLEVPFTVISNPEFLKEGAAVNDCMRPDRIVIGLDLHGESRRTVETAMRELYAPFNRNHEKILFMDVRSAELTKYAANCMLATKISFMNEMANIAERVGADIEFVRQGIGSDPRIGYQFIYPGCGYGGSCFPKDVKALINTSKELQYQSKILEAVETVNNTQKHKLFDLICRHFNCSKEDASKALKGKTFSLWGLAFKPNTDDVRDAPSRVLLELLWKAGAKVQAFDPEAMEEIQRIYGLRGDLSLVGTKEAALRGADALVICTEWKNFRTFDDEYVKTQLSAPVIFDGRNMYEPERMKMKGYAYYSIGRSSNMQGSER